MSEVRRHQRKSATGKTVTVRHHTRGDGTAAERKREAWEKRAAERWTPPPPAEDHAAPNENEESWWDEDEPRPQAWMAEPEREPSQAFLDMQQEMRDWRGRDIQVPPAQPDTSQLGRVLGTDTQEGADKFARLKAYREAGYDGPLDQDNQIPDPDDPAERDGLEALASMRSQHG